MRKHTPTLAALLLMLAVALAPAPNAAATPTDTGPPVATTTAIDATAPASPLASPPAAQLDAAQLGEEPERGVRAQTAPAGDLATCVTMRTGETSHAKTSHAETSHAETSHAETPERDLTAYRLTSDTISRKSSAFAHPRPSDFERSRWTLFALRPAPPRLAPPALNRTETTRQHAARYL